MLSKSNVYVSLNSTEPRVVTDIYIVMCFFEFMMTVTMVPGSFNDTTKTLGTPNASL